MPTALGKHRDVKHSNSSEPMLALFKSTLPSTQVDVVEAQSAALLERMGKARDFEDAEAAHAAFLAGVLEQTLLSSPRVATALEAIYKLCTRLCNLVQVQPYHEMDFCLELSE